MSHSADRDGVGSRMVGTELVAPRPHVDVVMSGVTVPSLVDTGSMVSTITESFFQEHFAPWGGERLQSCHWLQLQAANGLAIPYLGYLELDVLICGKRLPRCGILVVKDPVGLQSASPGIVGMNIIRRCYQELFGAHGQSLFGLPAVVHSPGPVVQALRWCHQSSEQDPGPSAGLVRVRGPQRVRISAGVMQLVPATCFDGFAGRALLFEPVESGLPAGLLISPCLVQTIRGTAYIPVVNVGTTEVVLCPRTQLGVLTVLGIVSLPSGVTEVNPVAVLACSQALRGQILPATPVPPAVQAAVVSGLVTGTQAVVTVFPASTPPEIHALQEADPILGDVLGF